MSKITFRADDDLVERLEAFDASKSEVLREALREYLDRHGESPARRPRSPREPETLDEMVTARVDALVADRLGGTGAQDVNVNITLEGSQAGLQPSRDEGVNIESDTSHESSNEPSHMPDMGKTETGGDENAVDAERKTCTQCGENLSPSHVYCPNCGEKSSHRVFCDCGDELRSDWAFCPGCGRRTPAADVLDGS